jgi:hypothetical protein
MAPRNQKRPVKNVKVDALAHARLYELQAALAREREPSYVDLMEILSALVMFTTPEQLVGMLKGYWRDTAPPEPGGGPSGPPLGTPPP